MAESDIFRVRPSAVPFVFITIGIIVLGVIVGFMLSTFDSRLIFAVAVIVVFALAVVALGYSTTEYALTTEKVHIRRGILTVFHEDIEAKSVSSVELHQKILGRILNYGDVVIHGDSPNSVITFHQIASPKFRHEQIEKETIG